MNYVAALVIALVLNASANVLMKLGMKVVQEKGGILHDGAIGAVKMILTSGTLIAGLICFALNAAFYMYALQSRALKISLAYPVMVGGGFALIVLAAHAHPALAERLTIRQWAGVALVFAGIVLIASASDSGMSATS